VNGICNICHVQRRDLPSIMCPQRDATTGRT
jgi:hypothetical protein